MAGGTDASHPWPVGDAGSQQFARTKCAPGLLKVLCGRADSANGLRSQQTAFIGLVLGSVQIAGRAKRVAVLGIKTDAQASQPAYFVPEYLQGVGVDIIPVPGG